MFFKKISLAVVAAMSVGMAQASLLTVNGGGVRDGDCTFACVNHYQQVYSSAVFGNDAINIDSISFISSGGGAWSAGNNWQISVSTVASNSVFNLNSLFSSNIGADNIVFDTKSFSGTQQIGSNITFNGSFNYNPIAGDLLIDIVALGNTGGPTVQYNNASWVFSRNYSFGNDLNGSIGNGYGNVTMFDVGQPSSNVPEPTSLALMGLGFAVLTRSRRRKPKQA